MNAKRVRTASVKSLDSVKTDRTEIVIPIEVVEFWQRSKDPPLIRLQEQAAVFKEELQIFDERIKQYDIRHAVERLITVYIEGLRAFNREMDQLSITPDNRKEIAYFYHLLPPTQQTLSLRIISLLNLPNIPAFEDPIYNYN